jgi:CBS domain-containing protein
MHTRVLSTHPTARLSDVAHQMIMNKLRSLPVICEGKVSGIIRLQDIFLHLEHETE